LICFKALWSSLFQPSMSFHIFYYLENICVPPSFIFFLVAFQWPPQYKICDPNDFLNNLSRHLASYYCAKDTQFFLASFGCIDPWLPFIQQLFLCLDASVASKLYFILIFDLWNLNIPIDA
jgi:hypothetical protein